MAPNKMTPAIEDVGVYGITTVRVQEIHQEWPCGHVGEVLEVRRISSLCCE
jgi:hypothetical protein